MAKQSLEQRISAAFKSNGSVDRDTLFSLWEEAFAEINKLKEVIETEEPRLLDIDNDDADGSRERIASSKLHIERLTKAIVEELKPRVFALDAEKARADWTAEADERRAINDELYEELEALYPPFFQQIVKLYVRIIENEIQISKLKARAPAGADKTFVPVEPHSRFWASINLPYWDSDAMFPPRKSAAGIAWEIQVAITNAMVAQAKANDLKFAPHGGQDWAEINKLERERVDAEAEKAEQELKEKDQAARDEYYKNIAIGERKRLRGEI